MPDLSESATVRYAALAGIRCVVLVAAGAKSFGYPTVWVNRFNQPIEELGSRPDQTFKDLNDLLDFVLNKPLAR